MQKLGRVSALDIHPEAVKLTKRRGISVTQASINKIPFAVETFDLVASIDVLCQNKVNDIKALTEFYRVLKPGGMVVIRVPALNVLITAHDRYVHTRQRYEKNELKKKLTDAHFQVVKISYVNGVLFFPLLLRAFWQRLFVPKKLASSVTKLPAVINIFLTRLLLPEAFIIKYIDLPFGIGLIAVAK